MFIFTFSFRCEKQHASAWNSLRDPKLQSFPSTLAVFFFVCFSGVFFFFNLVATFQFVALFWTSLCYSLNFKLGWYIGFGWVVFFGGVGGWEE